MSEKRLLESDVKFDCVECGVMSFIELSDYFAWGKSYDPFPFRCVGCKGQNISIVFEDWKRLMEERINED
jgi:hypothetical protein